MYPWIHRIMESRKLNTQNCGITKAGKDLQDHQGQHSVLHWWSVWLYTMFLHVWSAFPLLDRACAAFRDWKGKGNVATEVQEYWLSSNRTLQCTHTPQQFHHIREKSRKLKNGPSTFPSFPVSQAPCGSRFFWCYNKNGSSHDVKIQLQLFPLSFSPRLLLYPSLSVSLSLCN